MRVIVIGAGIIGLTTGLALRDVGFEVLVCEQAPEIRAAGASLGAWRNALAVYDRLVARCRRLALLAGCLTLHEDVPAALVDYEAERIPHYEEVARLSAAVEHSATPDGMRATSGSRAAPR